MKKITLFFTCFIMFSSIICAQNHENPFPIKDRPNFKVDYVIEPIGVGDFSNRRILPCTNSIIEVNQEIFNTCMADFTFGSLIAQSYIPTEAVAAGAGIRFEETSTGLDVNLSLWNGLPNAGGTMLASGTSQTVGTNWADVFWDSVVYLAVGNTYYIVMDGDPSLPCISGSTSDVYPGGSVVVDYTFPSYDFAFRTYSCDDGSGGETCDQENPENFFEGGFTNSSNQNQRIAMDITVPANTDYTMNTATVNIWMNPGSTVTSSDITFYSDAGGAPGTVISTQNAIVPTSQTVIGDSFGLDVSELVFDITPEIFAGQVDEETTYWVSITVNITSGDGYISSTTVSIQGFTAYFSPDAGVTWVPSAGADFVYKFEGSCEPMQTASISENALEDFTYYPNPTNRILSLKSVNNIDTVAIFNLLGQQVISTNIGANTSDISLSGLKAGTYIMKVTVDGQIGTYKVLKN